MNRLRSLRPVGFSLRSTDSVACERDVHDGDGLRVPPDWYWPPWWRWPWWAASSTSLEGEERAGGTGWPHRSLGCASSSVAFLAGEVRSELGSPVGPGGATRTLRTLEVSASPAVLRAAAPVPAHAPSPSGLAHMACGPQARRYPRMLRVSIPYARLGRSPRRTRGRESAPARAASNPVTQGRRGRGLNRRGETLAMDFVERPGRSTAEPAMDRGPDGGVHRPVRRRRGRSSAEAKQQRAQAAHQELSGEPEAERRPRRAAKKKASTKRVPTKKPVRTRRPVEQASSREESRSSASTQTPTWVVTAVVRRLDGAGRRAAPPRHHHPATRRPGGRRIR